MPKITKYSFKVKKIKLENVNELEAQVKKIFDSIKAKTKTNIVEGSIYMQDSRDDYFVLSAKFVSNSMEYKEYRNAIISLVFDREKRDNPKWSIDAIVESIAINQKLHKSTIYRILNRNKAAI